MDCQKSSTPVPVLSKRHGHSHVPDKSKKRRHRHSKQDWEDIREPFKTLYLQEDRTLEGVMESMRVSHGFEARYVSRRAPKHLHLLRSRIDQ